jgi:hypothetical protein
VRLLKLQGLSANFAVKKKGGFMKRNGLFVLIGVLFLGLSVFLAACGGSSSAGGGGSQQGAVNLSVADAPGDFDHVYITVKDVWFHTSDIADPRAAGWLKYPLATPVTVDLLTLANGNMQSIWNNIQLPVGTYKQIRILLEPTYPTITNPAPSGHTYFNEVVSGLSTSPLHIPDAEHGIKLIGAFAVKAGAMLKLAIDFDAGHDIVEFREGTDYVLKPRLNYFDLDHVGAIIGTLSTGGTFTTAPHFVIKAERLDSDGTNTYHVIRRWTVPKADGSFILYPVSTLVTSTWDIVVRGLNQETVIIKGVPITNGSTPTSGATNLGTIDMSPVGAGSQDYPVAGTITSPTGAWVQFYQTLPGANEYPYEIRFRHFNPLWGGFRQTFMLNNDQVLTGNYISSGVISTLTATIPVEGVGRYQAVAGAILFNRSTAVPVSSATTTVGFTTPLAVTSPYVSNSVTGTIVMNNPGMMNNMMDKGLLFAVNGGMIVNSIDVSSSMMTGGPYTISDLPGGTFGTPLPGAFYGVDAVGWSSTNALHRAIAIPQIVDLRTGNDTATMTMLPLW